jgi:hypothetical protein
MSLWLVPFVGVSGLLVCRAWRHDAALRSGELMDVRDVFPDGAVDLELLALSGRFYRLELQFEAVIEAPAENESTVREESSPSGDLPYWLRVERIDGPILYERERALSELFRLASSAREPSASGGRSRPTRLHWGCVPLLDFRASSPTRLRFEFSIPTPYGQTRLEKAQLILKEDVRPLRYSKSLLDRLAIDEPRGGSPA